MRLKAPCQAIDFKTNDIYGRAFQLRDYLGKRVMLSFFRDAACPFCNFRVYELTHQHKSWQKQNLEVIAVFNDSRERVLDFVARHPRPFRMLADPDLDIYDPYGVEKSSTALLKAMMFHMPRLMRGMLAGGRPRMGAHMRLVPADFLIDEKGLIQEVWYGRNTSDHIPIKRIDAFVEAGRAPLQTAATA